jgi:pimeloyl-ACP methyl ester carboxylesterase
MASTSPRAVADGSRGLALRPSSLETLETITVPTLVVVGEHDQLTPPADSEAIANDVTGAQLLSIDQAGHMSNMENPDAVNDALVSFITSVATDGRRVR